MAEYIKFVKAHPKAKIPVRAYSTSVGLDVFSCEDVVIKARESGTVETGIKAQPPDGTFLFLTSRSGLAKNFKVLVGAGILDSNFTGNLVVLLFNHSDVDFKVDVNARIAQLLCLRVALPEPVLVKELESTERGAKSFGSSGNL